MKPLSSHHAYFPVNHLIPKTEPHRHSNALPLLCGLNKINNSSMNLYGGKVVETSGFFAPPLPAIKPGTRVAATGCHHIHGRVISYGDSASHSQWVGNNPVSNACLSQHIRCVTQSRGIHQRTQTADVLTRRNQLTTPHETRNRNKVRMNYFVKHLSSTISILSRAGIDIPDGLSPHTIYSKLMSEKRKAEQLGYPFNKADFQQRINDRATARLPGVMRQYATNTLTALKVFSALHSRSAQRAILPFIEQRR